MSVWSPCRSLQDAMPRPKASRTNGGKASNKKKRARAFAPSDAHPPFGWVNQPLGVGSHHMELGPGLFYLLSGSCTCSTTVISDDYGTITTFSTLRSL